MKDLIKAVRGSEDWDVYTGTQVFPHPVRALRLTSAAESGSTALTIVTAKNETKSTGELGLHALEPMPGIKEVTVVGAGVLEYRVYY